MVSDPLEFDQRLRRLTRKHRAMAGGYVTRMRPDGLIVAQPRRAQARISGRSVILFILAFFLFKGFLIANLGPETYGERVGRLRTGTPVEQAGALVMQADPASAWISEQIGPVLR